MIYREYTHMDESGAMQYRPQPPNRDVFDWVQSQFAGTGSAVDIGASDGISWNSTYLLEQSGWSVLSVEANPYFESFLRQHRKMIEMCAASSFDSDRESFHVHLDNPEAFSALIPSGHDKLRNLSGDRWQQLPVSVSTLDRLLDRHGFDHLDLLCIDTEGSERDVLSGIDLDRWNPRVIVVESWDEGSLDDVLMPLGFNRVWRNGDNDGFVR